MRARIEAGQGVGVLFGRERTGLENEDTSRSSGRQSLDMIVVNPAYASLNLAQAVLILGYAWREAQDTPLPFAFNPKWPPATREMMLSFFEFLEGKPEARGFYRPAKSSP